MPKVSLTMIARMSIPTVRGDIRRISWHAVTVGRLLPAMTKNANVEHTTNSIGVLPRYLATFFHEQRSSFSTLHSIMDIHKSNHSERQSAKILHSSTVSFVRLVPEESPRYRLLSPRQPTFPPFRMHSSTSTVNNANKEETKETLPNNNSSLKASQTKGDSPIDDAPSAVAKPTFRTMVRQYGPLFIVTYLSVYVSTVFGFYLGIESGWLDPAYLLSFISADGDSDFATNSATAITNFLNHYSWTQWAVPYVEKNPWAANLAVAWIVTKPTEPIRFGVTVGLLPLLARKLGNTTGATRSTSTVKE
jgi:hypothetical protein